MISLVDCPKFIDTFPKSNGTFPKSNGTQSQIRREKVQYAYIMSYRCNDVSVNRKEFTGSVVFFFGPIGGYPPATCQDLGGHPLRQLAAENLQQLAGSFFAGSVLWKSWICIRPTFSLSVGLIGLGPLCTNTGWPTSGLSPLHPQAYFDSTKLTCRPALQQAITLIRGIWSQQAFESSLNRS